MSWAAFRADQLSKRDAYVGRRLGTPISRCHGNRLTKLSVIGDGIASHKGDPHFKRYHYRNRWRRAARLPWGTESRIKYFEVRIPKFLISDFCSGEGKP
jgi:hypothetical protein